MKTEIPIDYFVCPVSKEPMTDQGGRLEAAGRSYVKDEQHGFWRFMPADAPFVQSDDFDVWQQLQDNGVVSYEADPEGNLGIGERDDFLQFAEFCQFRGRVLDVGSGPQRCPTHIEFSNAESVEFFGIDPLVGDQPKGYAYVNGLGEYLPFRNELFDQVLFVTSLDHFIEPREPLREARRVVKRDGHVLVWVGVKDPGAPKPAKTHAWYEGLQVPPGAEDAFHYKRLSEDDFEACVRDSELTIVDKQVVKVDEFRRNLFYRLAP